MDPYTLFGIVLTRSWANHLWQIPSFRLYRFGISTITSTDSMNWQGNKFSYFTGFTINLFDFTTSFIYIRSPLLVKVLEFVCLLSLWKPTITNCMQAQITTNAAMVFLASRDAHPKLNVDTTNSAVQNEPSSTLWLEFTRGTAPNPRYHSLWLTRRWTVGEKTKFVSEAIADIITGTNVLPVYWPLRWEQTAQRNAGYRSEDDALATKFGESPQRTITTLDWTNTS